MSTALVLYAAGRRRDGRWDNPGGRGNRGQLSEVLGDGDGFAKALYRCGVILDHAPHLAAARPITGSRNNFGKTYWRIRQYWKIFHYLTEVRQVWVVARSSAARAAATAARSSSSAGSVVSTGAAPVRSKGAWIWAWWVTMAGPSGGW